MLGMKHPGPRNRVDVEQDKEILMAYYEEYEPSLADETRVANLIRKFRQQYGGAWRDTMYKKIGAKRQVDPRDFWKGDADPRGNGDGHYDDDGSPPCGACDGTGRERVPPDAQED